MFTLFETDVEKCINLVARRKVALLFIFLKSSLLKKHFLEVHICWRRLKGDFRSFLVKLFIVERSQDILIEKQDSDFGISRQKCETKQHFKFLKIIFSPKLKVLIGKLMKDYHLDYIK